MVLYIAHIRWLWLDYTFKSEDKILCDHSNKSLFLLLINILFVRCNFKRTRWLYFELCWWSLLYYPNKEKLHYHMDINYTVKGGCRCRVWIKPKCASLSWQLIANIWLQAVACFCIAWVFFKFSPGQCNMQNEYQSSYFFVVNNDSVPVFNFYILNFQPCTCIVSWSLLQEIKLMTTVCRQNI